jgi:hypothetical protein
VDDYFSGTMVLRQRLFWTVATRRQLERWESILAPYLRDRFRGQKPEKLVVWSAEIEHHFALIAARNLLRALDLDPPSNVSIDPTLRAELIEGRDLNEHWTDNMPVFNVTPRRVQPRRRSGRNFAERNPRRGPYWWLGWSSKTGARLLPHVTAPALHEVLDGVEAEVLAERQELRKYLVPRAPSPWIQVDGEWWPGPAESDEEALLAGEEGQRGKSPEGGMGAPSTRGSG